MSAFRDNRGAALMLALLGLALALAGCGTMSEGELDRRIEALGSIAAEGRLLAGETGDDSVKTTFTRVRARELAEDADHEAEKMADATPAEGQAERRNAAVALAESVSDALGILTVHPENERQAGDAERQLRADGADLSDLLEG